MGGRHKSLYLPSALRGLLLQHNKIHFGFSSHGENHFPFNALCFLIYAAQIKCSHTTESDVCGSLGECVLVFRLKTGESGIGGLVVVVK